MLVIDFNIISQEQRVKLVEYLSKNKIQYIVEGDNLKVVDKNNVVSFINENEIYFEEMK